MTTSKNKVYQKGPRGNKFRDNAGFTRYSRDGGKTVYGDNYRLGVATKRFR